MSSVFEVVTFDCYGTLIDWETGIASAFESVWRSAGQREVSERILELHAEIEPQVQAAGYRCYREVLDETADRIAARLGIDLPADEHGFLSRSVERWPPFSDTRPALEKLVAAGYRLGVLSNTDDDLFAATRRRLGVELDVVVTAEQVGSYKPALGHFLEARKRIGDKRWLHVAQSLYHDIAPAEALDIPAVWINRKQEPLPQNHTPLAVFPDVAGFAGWLVLC